MKDPISRCYFVYKGLSLWTMLLSVLLIVHNVPHFHSPYQLKASDEFLNRQLHGLHI
jgi:hypothetical protein